MLKLKFIAFAVVFLLMVSTAISSAAAPSTTITSPESVITNTSFQVTGFTLFSATTESIKGNISFSLDGGLPFGQQNCTSTTCLFSLAASATTGNHTLQVLATAADGTTSTLNHPFTVSSSGTTPEITVTTPLPGATTGLSYSVAGSIKYQDRPPQTNDWGIVYISDSNGTAFMPTMIFCKTQTCPFSATLQIAGEGAHTLTVSTTPIISGVYNLPTATVSVPLNQTVPGMYDLLSSDYTPEGDGIPDPWQCFASTANLVTGQIAFELPLNDTLSLFYNSGYKETGSNPMGKGWSHSFDVNLRVNSNGSVVLRGAGIPETFYTLSGGSYVSPLGDSSVLSKNASGYSLSYRNGTVYTFDFSGLLVSITDRFGNQTTVSRSGNTTTATDYYVRTFVFTATDGKITSITTPAGAVFGLSYGTSGQIQDVTFPTQAAGTPVWHFGYDPASGAMTSKTDPAGNATTYTVDYKGKVQQAALPGGSTKANSYGTGATTYTGEVGQTTTVYYGSDRKITTRIEPSGGVVRYTYGANGKVEKQISPVDQSNSYATEYQYDQYGNVTRVKGRPVPVTGEATAAYDLDTSYTYDYSNYDQVSSVTNNLTSKAVAVIYDLDNGYRRSTTTSPGGAVTVTRFENHGGVKDITAPDGTVTSFAYSANKLLLSRARAGEGRTEYSNHDAAGRPQTIRIYDQSGALKQTLAVEYTSLGKTAKATATGVSQTQYIQSYAYDLGGNNTRITDANGNQTGYAHNARGQVTSIDGPISTTGLLYDACPTCGGDGRVSAVVDPNGEKTSFEYNASGQLVKEIPPVGDAIAYTYRMDGRPLQKKNGTTGVLISSYGYDSRGRLARQDNADGTWKSFSYDLDGNLITAANQSISYTMEYDADGRLTKQTDAAGNIVSYTYNQAGQKFSTTVTPIGGTGHTITYSYTNGRVTGIASSLAGTFSYSYDGLGRRSATGYPNGITAAYSYHADQPGWLSGIDYGSVYSVNYPTFDKTGNRTSRDDGALLNFSYDAEYRLLSALPSGSTFGEKFTYDPAGNRLSGPGTIDTGFTSNKGNQLAKGRLYSYLYDSLGNQTNRVIAAAPEKTWTHSWNDNGELGKSERLKPGESRTSAFAYDPFGRRIGKTVTSVVNGVASTRNWSWIYDGADIAYEGYAAGAVQEKTHFVHGTRVDEHLGLSRDGQSYFYLTDGLGSVAKVVDTSKAIIQSYSYDSYGLPQATTGFRNSFTFTGREWDGDIGLMYYRARYYDPVEGIFISKDPLGWTADVNVYRYVGGNPGNAVDPWGLCPWCAAAEYTAIEIEALAVRFAASPAGQRTITSIQRYGNQAFNSFTKLKDFLGSPGPNSAWHHVVEKCQIEKSGFSPQAIHNTANIIQIDTATHAKISGYYNRILPFTDGLKLRDWLSGQSFQTQYDFGIKVLRDHGVLK